MDTFTWVKIVLVFVAISLPARCVGEWKAERDNAAYVEQHSTPQIAPIIPDCQGRGILFEIDNRGLIHYSCDWR